MPLEGAVSTVCDRDLLLDRAASIVCGRRNYGQLLPSICLKIETDSAVCVLEGTASEVCKWV